MSKLRTPVNEHDHQTGKSDASVILVEYGDYQCSHCGFAHPLIKKLIKQFRSELLFVFRNFPIRESHPQAMIAAQAAEAAGLQGKFWEMHDLIYEHQNELAENKLVHFADMLDLNNEGFVNDLKSQAVISKIDNDFESGARSGVNGTPTFFINGIRLDNYNESYASLVEAVNGAK
jgi:protein-disulfide isomerase